MKRIYPNNHRRSWNWNRSACIGTLLATAIETTVIMWQFGAAWRLWNLEFKVATPILHCVFSTAQVWGSKNYWCMWQAEQRKMEVEK
jgi:hypothetical protein